MTWEGTGASGGYDTGAYPPGPARTGGAGCAGIGFAAAVFAVIAAAMTVWVIRVHASAAQVPLVTSVGPRAIAAGTGKGADATGAAGSGPAGTSAAASSSPLDRIDHAWAARA